MRVCLRCDYVFSSYGWACPSCGYQPIFHNGFSAHSAELDEREGGGFRSEYFSALAKLEATNFWFRVRNGLILWALRTYKSEAHTFLEVGCGTGYVLSGIAKAYPKIALTGSEIFLAGLSHAVTRVPTASFMQMDARHVPFLEEFDAIGAFDVLEHIEEDTTVLVQLHRALKSDGVLLLTVPQHSWLWSTSDEYACHVRRYTCLDIENKVQRAGFEILRSTSFVTTILPAMILSRQIQKKREKNGFDPVAELKLNPVVNKMFESLMKLELEGIKLGFNYPFGGSRLVVARKKQKC